MLSAWELEGFNCSYAKHEFCLQHIALLQGTQCFAFGNLEDSVFIKQNIGSAWKTLFYCKELNVWRLETWRAKWDRRWQLGAYLLRARMTVVTQTPSN